MALPHLILGIETTTILDYLAIIAVLGYLLTVVPGLIWLERVFMALMQDRLGPNRVGPRGLIQPIADGLKLFMKEDIQPRNVDSVLYYLAPVFTLTPALAAGAVLPLAQVPVRNAAGAIEHVPLCAGNVNIGILFVLAMTSLQVYGIILAGWSSNNKYSLLGGLRASAQTISYELAMSMAVLTAILMCGSLNLVDVVHAQSGYWFGFIPKWNVLNFYGLGFIATCIYLISMVAETNRAPFDLPEAESELIAGFHTEYSSMKFAMFFMGEYASMLVVCSVATVLWFGGWNAPLPFLAIIPGWIWLIVKLMTGILVYIWLRTTLPRLRYDALMALGWKRLLPTGIAVLFFVALIDALGHSPREVTQHLELVTPEARPAQTDGATAAHAPITGPGWVATRHAGENR